MGLSKMPARRSPHSALEINSALMYFDPMFETAKAQLAAAADKASHLRRFL
jgi:hypothetical protein